MGLGRFVVDHGGDVGDVETSGGEIGGEEVGALGRTEGGEG